MDRAARIGIVVACVAALAPSARANGPAAAFRDAVAVWHFKDLGDAAGADSALKGEGAVKVGVELPGADRAESHARGGDGLVAKCEGGFLVAGQGAGGELNLTGRAFSLYARLQSGGDWSSCGIVSKHGGHGRLSYNLHAHRGRLGFELGTGAGLYRVAVSATAIGAKDWHDVVARWDGQRLELLVDGRDVSSCAASGELRANDEPLVLAGWSLNKKLRGPFRGRLDTVAVWKRALTDAEVVALAGGTDQVARRKQQLAKRKREAEMAAYADLPQPVAAYRKMISSPAMTTELPAADEQAKRQAVRTCAGATRELRAWMIANDPHRPIYHFTGAEGWINDPNGPIYYKPARRGAKDAAGGQYHLFYQFDPMVPDGRGGWRRSQRTWGHAVSTDCVHWQDWPVAVWPDTKWDRAGVYSGNSFVDEAGNLCAIYTGNVAGHRETYGLLVRSRDGGLTFDKRMVMDNSQRPNKPSPVHWDGQTWKEGQVWCQLIGGCTAEPNRQGAAWLWKSRDLLKWELQRNIAPSIRLGRYWELPYLIFVDGRAVLMVGHGNPYWVGSYDRKKMLFTPDKPQPESFDNGTYYSFNPNMTDDKGPSGSRRQIVHGWARLAASPTKAVPWWHGAHSLPRVVSVRGGRLWQEPIPEIESLRGRRRQWKDLTVQPGKGGYLEGLSGDAMEIVVTFAGGGEAGRFGLKLRTDAAGRSHIPVVFDRKAGTFHAAGKGGQSARIAASDDVTLRVFLDRSIVEVYVNGFAVTGFAFPPKGADGIDLFAEGGAVRVRSVDAWEMKSMWGVAGEGN